MFMTYAGICSTSLTRKTAVPTILLKLAYILVKISSNSLKLIGF